MAVKNILYIEANLDGTIGGSYYSLFGTVKRIDKSKFNPTVTFYQDNMLTPEFKKYCKVIILDPGGLVIKKDYPSLYAFSKKIPLAKKILLLYQKAYNFLRYYVIFYLKVIYILLRYNIDLIHANNAPEITPWLITSKFVGIKCISHLRGNWSPTPLQKRLAKYYNSIISISNSVTHYVKEKGINIDNFITIYDGIDITAVLNMRKRKSDDLRRELNVSDKHFLVGIIGNFKNWKGQHVAVEAAKLLKDKYPHIKYLFIGAVSNLEEDKKYYQYVKDMVNRSGLNRDVIFTGFRTDIQDIISVLDILVHTSIAPEPFGRVILEGMIFSKPVIATAHGGPLEIIEDGLSGFLIPPSDPKALAKKIDYLITNHAIRQQVGICGRKRVEEYFNIETNVRQIEQVYSKHLGGS